MNARVKPTLTGERVTLRPVQGADAEELFAMVQEPEGKRFTGTQRSFTLDEIRNWCARVALEPDRIDCAITLTENGAYLGEVVLNEIDEVNRCANFRISLKKEVWNHGYGSEAARLLLGYGFGTLGLHRIELEVFAFNTRALRVYEKLGFRLEGRRREALRWEGRYHDALLMGLLEHEFAQDPAQASSG